MLRTMFEEKLRKSRLFRLGERLAKIFFKACSSTAKSGAWDKRDEGANAK